MYHDMKPTFKAKVVGHAAAALLRPVLKHEQQRGEGEQDTATHRAREIQAQGARDLRTPLAPRERGR